MVPKIDINRNRPHVGLFDAEPAPARDWLLRAVDAGLAGVIFVVPWCYGGRHPSGELALVLFALIASLAWIARQAIYGGRLVWLRSPAEGIFAACLALVIAQLIPWPQAVLDVLAPHTRGLLSLWQPGVDPGLRLGVWNQVSLAPDATLAGLITLLAYGLLFFTAVSRFGQLEDIERVLRWLAISVAIYAAFGLMQYLTSNGRFLWVFKHPFRHTDLAATGMFINKNHFAHFLALGVGPLLWCLSKSLRKPTNELELMADSTRTQPTAIWLLALGIVLFGGVMSLSRGGVAMMGLAAGSCGGALWYRGLFGRRFAYLLCAVFAFIGCSLAIHGHRAVADRLQSYTSTSLDNWDQDGGRRKIWKADLAALGDYFVFGAGIGAHRDIYPMYLAESHPTEFTHAENGYLQIALEAGLPGVVLLAASLAYLASWCYRALRQARSQRLFGCAAAVTTGLMVSLIHSCVDFVWYLPSCMAVTLILAACALRLRHMYQPEQPAIWTIPRPCLAIAGALVALAGPWMAYDRFCATMAAPHWDAYLAFALSPVGRAEASEPGPEVIAHLEQVVRWMPHDARAHLRLAGACLRRFEALQAASDNAMPLNQVRDAALASQFASPAALDAWLARAIGDHRRYLDAALWHTRRAMSSAPLAGEGYLYLAELCFLRSPDLRAKTALLEQALHVRPHSDEVLMCAGSEAALAGDFQRALDFWRRAFRTGPEAQRRFIDLWSGSRMPVQVVLREFAPDLPAARLLDQCYSRLDPAGESQVVLAYYADVTRTQAQQQAGAAAAQLWLELRQIYSRLHDDEQELFALRQAATLAPGEYSARWALAEALCQRRQFAEAEPHLRWCSARRPNDTQVDQWLTAVVRGRVAGQTGEARAAQARPEVRR